MLGILLIILGATCIVKAQTATTFSILALGWVLAISAVFWFIGSFQAMGWSGFFLYLLNALIRGVVGYLLIRHPNAGAEGVTMCSQYSSSSEGCSAQPGRVLLSSPGGGGRFLRDWSPSVSASTFWPFILTASTFFVGIAIGVDLIFDGGALIAFAGAIHSLPNVKPQGCLLPGGMRRARRRTAQRAESRVEQHVLTRRSCRECSHHRGALRDRGGDPLYGARGFPHFAAVSALCLLARTCGHVLYNGIRGWAGRIALGRLHRFT